MIINKSTDPLEAFPSCRNCQSTLWEGDSYCSDCGQKVRKGLPSLWQLFGDFFETVFNLDNRVFRTLAALVVPGRLTKRYASGQLQPYLNPLRFFFFAAVAMLTAFAFLISSVTREDIEENKRREANQGFHHLFLKELSVAADSVRGSFPAASSVQALDSLEAMLAYTDNDSTITGYLKFTEQGLETQEITMASADVVALSTKKLLDKYEINGWFSRFQVAQLFRIKEVDTRGISILMSQLIWGLLLLIPLCALLLKLIHFRQKRYFMEHFVFSLHVHTFYFLLLIVATLLYHFFDNNLGYWTTLVLAPLYFYVALLRYYKQGWFKTLAKMILLFGAYLGVVLFSAIFSALVSLVLY